MAADDNDFIYAGAAGENGKITVLYTGKEEQKADEWDTITLELPMDASDIFVTAGGTIYAADRLKCEVLALEGTGVTGYDGELLDVLDDYVVSQDGDKLILKELKK